MTKICFFVEGYEAYGWNNRFIINTFLFYTNHCVAQEILTRRGDIRFFIVSGFFYLLLLLFVIDAHHSFTRQFVRESVV